MYENGEYHLGEEVQNNKMIQQGKYKIITNKCCADKKRCLDGSDGTIKFRECHEGEKQGWKIEYQGDGFYNVKSVSELGKCWSFEGEKVILKECNGKSEQSFKLHGSDNLLFTPKNSMVFKDRCTKYEDTTCKSYKDGTCKTYN